MKKYTILTFALVFGIVTKSTSAFMPATQDDSLKQRTPVSIVELPEEITEAIQNEFEDYRITYAFKYSNTDAEGLEQTTQGTGISERTGTERDRMHEGMKQGAERSKTEREEMHEEMHEGSERMEAKHDKMRDTLQGAERTGREGMQQGAERTGTQEEFLFTDEYDTYYEIQLEGPDMITVWYTEDGERIENETESVQRK
jgi:hypothetical protein